MKLADTIFAVPPAEKEKALGQLKLDIKKVLPQARLIFGEGDMNARLVLVGEAPGREEELQGRVFVGPAGRLLNQLLTEVSLDRSKLWLTNVIKWRPIEVKDDHLYSRSPNLSEVSANRIWLERELQIIGPDIILCLGQLSAREVIKNGFRMSSQHGVWFEGIWGIEAIATYHPSYVLRWGRRDQLITWLREDLAKVKNKYDELEPVTDINNRNKQEIGSWKKGPSEKRVKVFRS